MFKKKSPPQVFVNRTLYRSLSELNWELLHRNCIGATYISLLEEASAGHRRRHQRHWSVAALCHSLSQPSSLLFFYRLADSTLTFFPSLLEIFRFDMIKSEVAIMSLKTAKNFFITSKSNNKIAWNWDCWVCQILQFMSKSSLKLWFFSIAMDADYGIPGCGVLTFKVNFLCQKS